MCVWCVCINTCHMIRGTTVQHMSQIMFLRVNDQLVVGDASTLTINLQPHGTPALSCIVSTRTQTAGTKGVGLGARGR